MIIIDLRFAILYSNKRIGVHVDDHTTKENTVPAFLL